MRMPILLPMPGCRCRDFQMAFYQFIGDQLLCRTFKWLLLNLQRLDFFICMSFLTIFTMVKIFATFRTTKKMLNASILRSCGCCFFLFLFLRIVWGFLWYLLMWKCVKLPYCRCEYRLYSYFYWVIKVFLWSAIIFSMH